MSKHLRFASIAVSFAALALAACVSTPPTDPLVSNDVRVRYPIVVTPGMRTLRLASNNQGAQLDPNMSAQLMEFVSDYKGTGVGSLSLAAPPNWDATSRALADRIVTMGVEPHRILVGVDPAPQPGREITLTFIRYVTETQPCGNWSVDLNTTYNNVAMPNTGCATQQNLAAMIADPRDLVAPKPLGPADAGRALTILDRYRQGLPTPAQQTEEQSGVITDVGN
jgi:pilus assembly protein CpaD